MGKRNSSEIRVAPFARELAEDHAKVERLLRLVGCDEIDFGVFGNDDVYYTGNETNRKKKGEMALPPSKEHLKRLAALICANAKANRFFKDAVEKSKKLSEKTKKMRLALANNELTLQEIFGAIDDGEAWAILEGASQPDLFIESDRAILVVEGKLTEPHLTSSTSYLQSRNQMLRHIQGAIEYNRRKRQNKRIVAFYIVPESFTQIDEIGDRTRFDEVLKKESLPITDPAYAKEIASCYFGCTTWEAIQMEFGVRFPTE